MKSETIIYSKKPGEDLVPVTVRIEWLPNGAINPLMFRTPDGERYDIERIYENKLCAHLKDRGVGMRFKVLAKLAYLPEYDDERLNTCHETYLYLIDNRFDGKDFIDERYEHACKEYIPVTLDVLPNGDYELIYFKAQGKRYMVKETREIEPRGSFKAGGVGICYEVDARLVNDDDDDDPDPYKSNVRPAALYFEVNKWFVTVAVGRHRGIEPSTVFA